VGDARPEIASLIALHKQGDAAFPNNRRRGMDGEVKPEWIFPGLSSGQLSLNCLN
jgi:hypothetical protein